MDKVRRTIRANHSSQSGKQSASEEESLLSWPVPPKANTLPARAQICQSQQSDPGQPYRLPPRTRRALPQRTRDPTKQPFCTHPTTDLLRWMPELLVLGWHQEFPQQMLEIENRQDSITNQCIFSSRRTPTRGAKQREDLSRRLRLGWTGSKSSFTESRGKSCVSFAVSNSFYCHPYSFHSKCRRKL
jgi:hypothetical protein